MQKASASGSNGIIFVELNYRLGALGFLSGPSLQAAGGVSNAAFYDQRLAIEWVSKYIHLFGGDPNRITLIGESAGGALRYLTLLFNAIYVDEPDRRLDHTPNYRIRWPTRSSVPASDPAISSLVSDKQPIPGGKYDAVFPQDPRG
jgi:hypothetical protein